MTLANAIFYQLAGIALVMLGILLFIMPMLLEKVPSLEEIPWILLYVYRSGNFTFVTSPILIIISILSVILYLIQRGMENYWLMYYSFLRREYFLLRERHDKYKRDNELFKALEKQNARLSACLAGQEACQEVRGGEDIQ